MKRGKFLLCASGLSFVLAGALLPARAQFYAPETQFHDVCQRHFVVEAARVLAWLDRQRGVPVTEVQYELKSTGSQGSEWRLRWVGAKAQELRAATVRYPASAATNGIAFYRDVFRQLGGSSNPLSGDAISSTALERAFWEGAERAGYSRMECLDAAFDLWKLPKDKLPGVEQAARLAGLLAQTPTHGFWQESALDARLVARAAAWLCVVESAGTTNDCLWSPILFVAGREWQAKAAWSARTNPPVAAWWNLLLSGASPKDAFLFIAAKQQRARAMPMMAWQSWIADGYRNAAGRLVQPLFSGPEQAHLRLYDYGPGFADSTVESGHLLDGWWPTLARAAWVKTLKAYPVGDLDYHGYTAALTKADAALNARPGLLDKLFGSARETPVDNSTRQLETLAPLLEIAYREATGPLTPVAHVTARDLLHYGWENQALHLCARYYFVRTKWGVPELAREILRAATNSIPQFGLLTSGPTNAAELSEALRRLQHVNWTFGGRWPAAGLRNAQVLTNDPSGMYQHWLRPTMAGWLNHYWLWAHAPEAREPFLARLAAEGGRQMNRELLRFLLYDGTAAELTARGPALTNGLPLATGLIWDYLAHLEQGTNAKVVPTPQGCREAEALFWTNPDSTVAPSVFACYLLAGELPAAKTFYREAMRLPYDAVGYSTRMQTPRWILARLEGDRKAMESVLKENETGSESEFRLRTYNAICQGDWADAEAVVQEAIDRYGAGKPGNPSSLEIMRRVLGLREALADPANPGHAHALGYMVNVTTLPVFQWVLIQQLKLSPADAAVFLGGEKASGTRRLLPQYFGGDKSGFEKTLAGMKPLANPTTAALAGGLRAKLLSVQPALDGKSQRPKDAAPIEELVSQRLEEAAK